MAAFQPGGGADQRAQAADIDERHTAQINTSVSAARRGGQSPGQGGQSGEVEVTLDPQARRIGELNDARPPVGRAGGLGERLGEALGEGLGEGLGERLGERFDDGAGTAAAYVRGVHADSYRVRDKRTAASMKL
jgi:hypothetical protein